MQNPMTKTRLFLTSLVLALCGAAAPALAQSNIPGPMIDAIIPGALAVTGTQTIADVGDCSRVSVTISGDVTGAVDDGGGVDQVSFQLWDDGSLKDSAVIDVPVGSTETVEVTLSFLGLYLSGAPGVGVLVREEPGGSVLFSEDPFFPIDVAGVCPSCGITPQSGCTAPGKSLLLLKNHPTDENKDKLVWKWLKGPEVLLADLGDPTDATSYSLCIYAGGNLAAHSIDAGPNWKTLGTKGYKQKDPTTAPDGIKKTVLKSGAAGRSKALVKGKGANLPDDVDGVLPFPVTVQLVNDTNATCLESVFNSALKNDGKKFKAKTP